MSQQLAHRVADRSSAFGELPPWGGAGFSKEIVVARLQIADADPGFCHFPTGRDLDYFEMLCAERARRRYVKGVAIREWVKASFSCNEALDCRVYATTALHALKAYGLRLDLVADRLAHTLPAKPVDERQGDDQDDSDHDQDHDREEPASRAPKRRRESWLGGRRRDFLR